MPYLTRVEYTDMGFTVLEITEFDGLIRRASDVIDNVTRHFYVTNSLEKDVSIRREQFKKAVAAQVEYFHETGATSSFGMNEPSSVTIGRTAMSSGGKNSTGQAMKQSTLSSDAADYLNSVGLLYRGLG